MDKCFDIDERRVVNLDTHLTEYDSEYDLVRPSYVILRLRFYIPGG